MPAACPSNADPGSSPGGSFFGDRRVLPDRREHPTELRSVWRLGGRRAGFRRVTEGQDQYVDRPSLRVLCLTLLIVLFSSLDAYFTLLHIEGGGHELNPLMHLALLTGVPAFTIIKICVSSAAAMFLATHGNFRLGSHALGFCAMAYTALLGYHGVLFLL
jgi:hypothetical protein